MNLAAVSVIGCAFTLATQLVLIIELDVWPPLDVLTDLSNPKAQNGPKTLYNMVFRPKSLKI